MFRWRDIILRDARMQTMLQSQLLGNVQSERTGELIDRVMMRKALSMLVNVNVNSAQVYEEDFEAVFLDETRTFYEIEAQKFLAENTVQDYLRKAEQRLIEEEQRADEYLNKSSKVKLLRACEEQLIAKYAQTLADNTKSGCVRMFEGDLVEDLGRMYSLYKREPGCLDIIRRAMFTLVKKSGVAIVSDPENRKNPHKFIDQMLALRHKYDIFLNQSFLNDKNFRRSIKEAFEDFANQDCRTAQFLSLFVDGLMKNDRGISDSEMELKMNNCIILFNFLKDKVGLKMIFSFVYSSRLCFKINHMCLCFCTGCV
jgi:cullin 3